MGVKIEFTEFVAQEKENPYIETVQALADLNDENAAVAITVEADKAQYERNQFQRAANKIGKTARLRHKTDADENGNVRLTFTLTEKHKARRGKSE